MITLEDGYRFEAEALTLSGYRIESSSVADASSGRFISTSHYSGATGNAYGKFTGEPGIYRVEVGYYDENDGKSPASVTVAGNKVQFTFDENLDSSLPAASTHTTTVTHPSITLKNGDSFSLYGKANGGEYARFDYIDFIRSDTPSDPPPSTDTSFGAFEAEVARLVNEFRVQNGKKALNVDSRISAAAEKHSDDMAFKDFFSHTGSDGSKVGARVSAASYDWRSVGENIAAGQTTPQKVFDAWKGSSGHRANMLGTWDDMGVGYEYLANDTGKVNYHHYWTLDFGLV